VGAQVLQLAIGRLALRQRPSARPDVAALAVVLGDLDAAVVVAGAVFVGFVGLHPVQLSVEQPEQDHEDDARPTQRSVHGRITSVGAPCSFIGAGAGAPGGRTVDPATSGWPAASEIRSSSAISSQLAISEEPPAERNGVVWPVSGIKPVTPPTI